MNIWILQAYDQPGGQSTRSELFAEEFSKNGHSVTFFTNNFCNFFKKDRKKFRGAYNLEENNGYQVVWLNTVKYKSNIGRLINMFDNFLKIIFAAFKLNNKPDVIIIPSVPPTTALAGILLNVFYRVKLIYEIRDVWPSALIDTKAISKFNFLYYLFYWIESVAYRRANLIVSTLDNVHSHVRKFSKGQEIVVIPNGISEAEVTDFNEEHYINCPSVSPSVYCEKKFVVMYVGGFGIDHDVMSILKAAEIMKDDKDVKFVFYGDGPNKPKCVKYAKNRELKNVELRGILEKSKIIDVQRQANVLVAAITNAPSYRFGINLNKIAYYIASGKPIVFSGDIFPKILVERQLGLVGKSGDIEKLVENLRLSLAKPDDELKRIRMRADEAIIQDLSISKLARFYLEKIAQL